MAFRWTKATQSFDRMRGNTDGAARRLKSRAAERWALVMQSLAPVDTGAMRDSIEAVEAGDAIGVRIGVDYYLFVEYGTVHRPANPFIRQSASLVERDFREDLRNFAQEVLK